MKSIFNSPKTSFVGIVPGLIIMLTSLSGLWGGPVPVMNDDGTPQMTQPEPIVNDAGQPVMNDDGTPQMTAGGEPVTQPAPPFNLTTLIVGLGLAGIGAAATDDKT